MTGFASHSRSSRSCARGKFEQNSPYTSSFSFHDIKQSAIVMFPVVAPSRGTVQDRTRSDWKPVCTASSFYKNHPAESFIVQCTLVINLCILTRLAKHFLIILYTFPLSLVGQWTFRPCVSINLHGWTMHCCLHVQHVQTTWILWITITLITKLTDSNPSNYHNCYDWQQQQQR